MPEHIKDPNLQLFNKQNIVGAEHVNHARYRKILARAFSQKAVREQQPIILGYVDKLCSRLREGHDEKGPIDLARWFSHTMFDIIGDLAFGEPFDCLDEPLRDPRDHPMVKGLWMPEETSSQYDDLRELSRQKLQKRLSSHTHRPDYVAAMTANKSPDEGLSRDEIASHASILIPSSTETMAAVLSAVIYYSAMNPKCLALLVSEIRSSFVSEAEINLISVQNLRYMLAAVDEAMRLRPGAPSGQTRVIAEGGDTILGRFVPEGTYVESWGCAVYRDPAHFAEPDAFIPERWLGDSRFAGDKRNVFLPFGNGPRDCIAQNLAYAEMRLILAKLLWNFDISLADESRDWESKSRIFMVYQKEPLYISISRMPLKRRQYDIYDEVVTRSRIQPNETAVFDDSRDGLFGPSLLSDARLSGHENIHKMLPFEKSDCYERGACDFVSTFNLRTKIPPSVLYLQSTRIPVEKLLDRLKQIATHLEEEYKEQPWMLDTLGESTKIVQSYIRAYEEGRLSFDGEMLADLDRQLDTFEGGATEEAL
ncbi:hypothetical protein NLG97_g3787 [Lecanicillium saksenae]|uniref:Uncharacterized protein n=1 Tax=Lecanicillium saksenae TaxID=468837 RepID=A0ACC1QXB0_9HYPO|nr:hypothetical protein NLG97_g3787 [Lecanicillium saksenae]